MEWRVAKQSLSAAFVACVGAGIGFFANNLSRSNYLQVSFFFVCFCFDARSLK